MKIKQSKENNPKRIFNPSLFWDAEDIDIERHAGYIISRIIDFGDGEDVKTLRSIYPDEKIIEVIRKRRNLMPQTAKFWAVYFNIPLKEIACLRTHYQNMQQK